MVLGMPRQCVPVFWRASGGNPVRQHETGGRQTAAEAGELHAEPPIGGFRGIWFLADPIKGESYRLKEREEFMKQKQLIVNTPFDQGNC